jgi:hypothetical protein
MKMKKHAFALTLASAARRSQKRRARFALTL